MCVSFWSVCIFFFSFSTKNPSTNLSGTRRQQCNFFPEGSTRSNGGKLYPTDKSLPRVFVNKNHCVIHWVVIYRADNFIYPLNNQVQKYFRNFIRCYPLRFCNSAKQEQLPLLQLSERQIVPCGVGVLWLYLNYLKFS